ncbi:hypothetical protein LCGC14_2658090 [marine sediment metagenome]|uniref:Major tropism determinant N-terminal domain-containing protein n=1 Tax=marine sediment metagenome TaxID=412755 RepID=A0A0F9CJU9_9ZZZZ
MASYNVLKSDGSTLATVTDLTINSSAASIKFIGRNIIDYGQDIAENQVHIMENFANTTEPVTPVAGQLWWDTNVDILKVFDGSTFGQTALQNIVEDTTPQLGGYLDTNTQNIGSTSDEIENIYVATDSVIFFGDGQESSIYYNGTALIIG